MSEPENYKAGLAMCEPENYKAGLAMCEPENYLKTKILYIFYLIDMV